MMHVKNPVISTESHTQARRLLDRFDALAPDPAGVTAIFKRTPLAPKRAQFEIMVGRLVDYFGDALIGKNVCASERGRRHFAEFILVGGRGSIRSIRSGADMSCDAMHMRSLLFTTGRSAPVNAMTPGALSLSRHALGRFLERRGFRAGQDDDAYRAILKSLGAIAAATWGFRDLLMDAGDDAPPLIAGFVRDAGGVWVINAMITNRSVGDRGGVRDSGDGSVVIRTFMSANEMNDAKEAAVARYEAIMANPSLTALEKATRLRLHDDDRFAKELAW